MATQNSKTSKKNDTNTTSNSEKKFDELKKQLDDYKNMVEELKNLLISSKKESAVINIPREQLNPNRLITVVSLTPTVLVLNNKNGREWVFTHIGAKQKIPALDLLEIYSMHETFATKGYYYICDTDFIEENGLGDIYSTLLPLEKIMAILDMPVKDMQSILENINLVQFQSIYGLLLEKLIDGDQTKEFDENKIKVIEKMYYKKFGVKKDIEEEVENFKYLMPKK